jgi:hypothetical protein
MASQVPSSGSNEEPTTMPKSVDELRQSQPPQKVAKPPKPRKVERRRRGRKS